MLVVLFIVALRVFLRGEIYVERYLRFGVVRVIIFAHQYLIAFFHAVNVGKYQIALDFVGLRVAAVVFLFGNDGKPFQKLFFFLFHALGKLVFQRGKGAVFFFRAEKVFLRGVHRIESDIFSAEAFVSLCEKVLRALRARLHAGGKIFPENEIFNGRQAALRRREAERRKTFRARAEAVRDLRRRGIGKPRNVFKQKLAQIPAAERRQPPQKRGIVGRELVLRGRRQVGKSHDERAFARLLYARRLHRAEHLAVLHEHGVGILAHDLGVQYFFLVAEKLVVAGKDYFHHAVETV